MWFPSPMKAMTGSPRSVRTAPHGRTDAAGAAPGQWDVS